MKWPKGPRASREGRRDEVGPEHHAAAWQSASLLLDYPSVETPERLAAVREAAADLPSGVREPLLDCAVRLGEVSVEELQAEYVGTFDSRKRNNLFLTYFAHGDTRKRGLALLRFKQTYAQYGVEIDESTAAGAELPDHLCVVLEFAALVNQDAGRQLMIDHRAGLELLRLSLEAEKSPWVGAVAAITATLPPMDDEGMDSVRRLAAEGPPEEEVGLSPYETPMFDQDSAPPVSSGPVQLPMPSFPGGR